MLKVVPFPSNHWCEDRIVLASSPSREFDQKSAYAIAKSDSGPPASLDGDWIWKIFLAENKMLFMEMLPP